MNRAASRTGSTTYYRIETARLRRTFTTWAETVDPTLGYSGRWIADMVSKILAGTN